MKKNITIALILAALLVVYMLFPDGRDNGDIKQALRDVDISKSTAHGAEHQDDSASSNQQEVQIETTRSYDGQQLEPEIEKALNELVNTSHEGLVEVQTDQGVGIDLKDRFRSAPVATIDADGQLVVQDYTSAPGR